MEKSNIGGKIFNVASGKTYSVNEIYNIITNILKTNIKPIYKEASHFWDDYPQLMKGYPIKREILQKEVDKFALGSNKRALEELEWQPLIYLKEAQICLF